MQINRQKVKQKFPRYEFELDNLHRPRYISSSFHRATSIAHYYILYAAPRATLRFSGRLPMHGT
ncbi:MAG: hypothetical protein ONB48_03460 [candidate division KSB1 bacterium]|nr:hypothetical protein [candidate division KSB1 bacterium]MDZ7275603.1 hypothetical protein [candidate division KSB1 bacterium]MDZ7284706.1 hypothetical protein [candidate division KSB1 bacterium]MDZ7297875.1 hypothetical protein [candidate division KSB1 bacterium]MDZ7305997.1 hypothetical protein [candidate division KSB1 bacterium]